MNFCIVVVHDLTNDIGYDVKLNRSKICYIGLKFYKERVASYSAPKPNLLQKKNAQKHFLSNWVKIFL